MPADARSVARVALSDLDDRITRRLTPPYNFDDYTYAHLTEVKQRIEKHRPQLLKDDMTTSAGFV